MLYFTLYFWGGETLSLTPIIVLLWHNSIMKYKVTFKTFESIFSLVVMLIIEKCGDNIKKNKNIIKGFYSPQIKVEVFYIDHNI